METRDSVGVRASLLYRSDIALISGVVMDFMKRNEIVVLVRGAGGGAFQLVQDMKICCPIFYSQKNYWRTKRMKPKSAYEDMWIGYIINVVNLTIFRSLFCDLLQGGVLQRIYYKDIKPIVLIQNIKF